MQSFYTSVVASLTFPAVPHTSDSPLHTTNCQDTHEAEHLSSIQTYPAVLLTRRASLSIAIPPAVLLSPIDPAIWWCWGQYKSPESCSARVIDIEQVLK